MKVLWITNSPLGPMSHLLKGNRTSGSWLDAAFSELKDVDELEIAVATISRVNKLEAHPYGKHRFYILPGGNASKYNLKSRKNKGYWDFIKQDFNPSLIHIWGTEFKHGLHAMQCMKDIPAVIYMQGVKSQIGKHFMAGISLRKALYNITLRDIVRRDWMILQQMSSISSAKFEARMIKMAGNVIVENDWCAAQCLAFNQDCKVFRDYLPIKDVFFKSEWNLDKMTPHTILTNAPRGPLKGTHILVKALGIVKKKYPDVKLLLPGDDFVFGNSAMERIKRTGYGKYLRKLIIKLTLKDNIKFLGRLTSEDMAANMEKANVFVMPSSVENHSATLIEAMLVGTPSVASFVGGIPEYMKHGINGLLYRFEDYEVLAAHIIKIMDDQGFSSTISSNSREMMRRSRDKQSNVESNLLQIYHKMK